jgi:uncharacterized protein
MHCLLASFTMLPILCFVFREVSLKFVTRQPRGLAAILFLLLAATSAFSQAPNEKLTEKQKQLAEWIKANYTKYEYSVPVRDGVHLFTSVYVPKDASPTNTYPIMFDRTPYSVSPYGVSNYKNAIGPSEQMARAKYIFAYQDVRGAFMSEGQYVNMRPHIEGKTGKQIDEASDTYDAIDWLIKNIPNNNGKVGMWGISYPGFYTAAGMIDAHPALKAVSPQAPIADWFIGDDFHHHGALYLPHFFNFIATFGQARPEPTSKRGQRFEHGTRDGYNFFLANEPLTLLNEKHLHHKVAFWDEVTQHPNYDQFWQARNLRQHLKNIKPAVMTVGGWFDAENLFGALKVYENTEKQSPQATNTIVMGPWCHGCWARQEGDHLGNVWFDSNTSEFYRESIELPFFEHYLKAKGDPQLPEAYMFETGTNQWRKYESWPPKQAQKTTLYFGANGKLTFDSPVGTDGFDEYVSDPAKPVPFITDTAIGMTREYMTDDQRQAGRRTDVLVYQTDPLDQDVTLAGPVAPNLVVSTSGTDSDFVVKLIDVYPDDTPDHDPDPETPNVRDVHLSGYQQIVRGEPMRARFRNSYEKPEPMEPNKATKVEWVMPDVNHTFRRGHRIMVQVQSSWFPLVDINPQKFVPNIYEAKAADFQKATQRVFHGKGNGSSINVWLLKK